MADDQEWKNSPRNNSSRSVITRCGGVATGPRCVACYDTAEQAEQVLAGIFAELGEGERAVSVPVIRAVKRAALGRRVICQPP
jgi:hypothetical protein